MALVHNCIIRALNSIYLQAINIPTKDYKAFTKYMLATYQSLEAHHDGEEEFFFPEIEKATGQKGLMDVNVKQHEAFHSGFHAWGAWISDLDCGKKQFDGKLCVELMDRFLQPLATHLADEIPTLLSLSKYGNKLDLVGLSKAEGDKVMGSLSKTTQLPLFWMNHDETFENGIHSFPPIPGPVKWTLRQLSRWNADWWKFGSCGVNGMPRELLFLSEQQ
jgi:hemerythrin-like domain-containing protein